MGDRLRGHGIANFTPGAFMRDGMPSALR